MPLPIGIRTPSMEGAVEWVNGGSDCCNFQNCPTVIQFWAVSCPICKMNMPRLQCFVQEYAAYNLRLLSVHMPRMEADTEIKKVANAIEELELHGPCAIDNEHIIGDRFQVKAWPSYFLFDAEGRLRSRAAGALGLKMAENSLKRMLGVAEKEGIAA